MLNTRALDTVRRKEKKKKDCNRKKGVGGGSVGRQRQKGKLTAEEENEASLMRDKNKASEWIGEI